MNYEKKYKEALEKARKINSGEGVPTPPDWTICEVIFPELKENEDEKIRKAILNYFTKCWGNCKGDVYGMHVEDAIAWLEKQGDKCLVNFDKAEQEKYDFVSGQYIECRASFNEFKEGNSYWLEYVGDDTYIGRSDNILNQKFHITPRQLYRLFTQQHFYKEDNTNDETNAPTEYGKYVDECLNEASKHFFSNGEDAYSVADLFYAGVRCGKSWFEKQSEQKSSTEVKPKFKQGEWIVWKDKYYKVNYNGCGYELFDQNGLSTSWDYKTIEDNAHLWTIEDAKEGDILQLGKVTAIFKELIDDEDCKCYCSVYDGEFEIPIQDNSYGYYNAIPATKEQRDLLFTKMKEAGYEWNAEKKELKKIEPFDKYEGLTDFERTLADVCRGWIGEEIGWKDYIIKNSLPLLELAKKQFDESTTWSEEDEEMLKMVIKSCEQCGNEYAHYWLKSLKPKPKQEWSKEDEKILDALVTSLNNEVFAGRLKTLKGIGVSLVIDWLKSLKQRITK